MKSSSDKNFLLLFLIQATLILQLVFSKKFFTISFLDYTINSNLIYLLSPIAYLSINILCINYNIQFLRKMFFMLAMTLIIIILICQITLSLPYNDLSLISQNCFKNLLDQSYFYNILLTTTFSLSIYLLIELNYFYNKFFKNNKSWLKHVICITLIGTIKYLIILKSLSSFKILELHYQEYLYLNGFIIEIIFAFLTIPIFYILTYRRR